MSGRIAFVTLGCAKNEVDSAHMQRRLRQAGYTIVSPEEPSDVVVINTCSFIQDAIEESLDAIFEIAGEYAVVSGETKLVVAGCLPARFGEDLETELTEPDRFLPCDDEEHIVEVVDELLSVSSPREALRLDDALVHDSPSAYVKISDGCDRFCSYCTIPYIRGRYRSFAQSDIVAEVERLSGIGVREVVLIAQDSGIWGNDLVPPTSLDRLLRLLATTFPDLWFRVMYLQPAGVTDQLLSVMEDFDNVCNYFDIPLQHCSETLLKSMNRGGSRDEFLDMVERIRLRLNDVALRTTLIVGYPGETEDDFADLCDFVTEAEFDYVGIFAYSPEEGTRAADMADQIDPETKHDRLQELRDIADTVSTRKIAERIGRRMDVLIEGTEEDGQLYGRAQCQAPEVDGVTYINGGSIGDVVPCLITDTLFYEMEGTCD